MNSSGRNTQPSQATAPFGICDGSNAPLRRLIPYSVYALRQARKFAHPAVLPASHLIPASLFSLSFSVTVIKLPSFICSSDISTFVSTSSSVFPQYQEIYLFSFTLSILTVNFISNSGNCQVRVLPSSILPVLLEIK